MRTGIAGTRASGLILEAAPRGEREDVYALAYMLNHRCSAPDAPYRKALGLEADELSSVVGHWFPAIAEVWEPSTCLAGFLTRHTAGSEHVCPDVEDDPGYGRFSRKLMQQEEADLCRLLLDHRSDDGVWPVLFARLIARACLDSDHLWICLGLENRRQMTAILERRFPGLAARNKSNMRWKKFFYRILCDMEKVWACGPTSCALCLHHAACYAGEA